MAVEEARFRAARKSTSVWLGSLHQYVKEARIRAVEIPRIVWASGTAVSRTPREVISRRTPRESEVPLKLTLTEEETAAHTVVRSTQVRSMADLTSCRHWHE